MPRSTPVFLRLLLALPVLAPLASAQSSIGARAETAPVSSSGDAADDPAIWVHPTDPSKSVIVATNKQAGLMVYDLAGNQLQFVANGEPNNVDLRKDFPLGGQRVTLVATGERGNNRMLLYVLDPNTRTLSNVAARNIEFTIQIYGCCLYRSPVTNDFYFFGTAKDGGLEQWRLFDNGSGKVDATRVRTLDVGGQCEGCVADDENAFVFIGEETVGVWRYGAEPTAGTTRLSVDTVSGPNLEDDVEGLSIYYASGGRDYLLVSSQGNNTFSVYERQAPHRHVLNFEIVTAGSVDGVTDCDGIDVMNVGLGSAFPDGLFVAQDGTNTGGNQNFKLLSWRDISSAASPALIVDTTYVPHTSSCTGAASASVRTGSNRSLLVNKTMPKMGTVWQSSLNCSGFTPSGYALLMGYSRSLTGPLTSRGQLLVDVTSQQVFLARLNHTAGTVNFNLTIPNDMILCGLPTFVQGLCLSPQRSEFSNAIDLVVGP